MVGAVKNYILFNPTMHRGFNIHSKIYDNLKHTLIPFVVAKGIIAGMDLEDSVAVTETRERLAYLTASI